MESSSPSESNDDYAEFGFADEPEKGACAVGILLCSMSYEKIDRATKVKLQQISKANNERAAIMKNSEIIAEATEKTKRVATLRQTLQQKIKKTETSNGKKKASSKKQQPMPSEDDGEKLCMQRFKKAKLGYGVDDIKLSDFPPLEKLKGIVGRCSKPFEKVLTYSDLNSNMARLALVKGHTQEAILPLLNEEEITALSTGMDINVTTFDGEGKEYNMVFKDWKQKKFYVLTKGWIPFLDQHYLIACEDWMTIWAFRHKHTGKLCFAVVSRRFPVQNYYNAK
ncbi:hypothetical protein LIER_09233 [Lithospermum erythrorhizon]|uniref:TF-B3 domain-containing protein n=1 Tax=Lithospermum erythrorhizon TaxID=34254 RepID=A0AAV3PF07_LITER